MKLKFIGLFFWVIIGNSLLAQSTTSAKSVLDAVSATIKNSKGIAAQFTLKTFTNGAQVASIIKHGSIVMKGKKFVMKQDKMSIICDGVKIYNYDGRQTITVSSTDEADQMLMNPEKLLSGAYDKDFTYTLAIDNQRTATIKMVPKDARKNFKLIELYVSKRNNMVEKVKLTDKGDNIIILSLSKVNISATIGDSKFQFNKANYPADVEVLE